MYISMLLKSSNIMLSTFLLCYQIKPVRESMTEALQHWKKLSGKAGDVAVEEKKAPNHGELK